MASAVDLVRQDHQRVRSLFDQFQRAVTSRQKKEIAEQTVMELEVHAKLEEHICRSPGEVGSSRAERGGVTRAYQGRIEAAATSAASSRW